MQKAVWQKAVWTGALLWIALLAGADYGQVSRNGTSKPSIGTVTIDADKTTGNPSFLHLIGHAKIVSANYDLYAADIKLYAASGVKPGAAGLREAVAVGGAVPGSQVVAHIRQPLQSASYTIYSDRAIYQPDASRPSGGALKFTGHVQVITKSGFLAVPSVSTTDIFTILLGVGADYPQVESGPLHATLTPAQ